ncbi:MAG: hypothetical protein NC453_18660 [Muribaculum sp.]|nr:hypothetical protein [Muribaculum sp.]
MKAMLISTIVITCLALFGACFVYWHKKQNTSVVDVMSEKETQSTKILGDGDSKINIPIECEIQYSHSIHGSVGYNYSVEYDKRAFKLSENLKYKKPDAVAKGMCGGDEAILTSTLTPMQKGKFTVKIIHTFRGSQERVITHVITVK